MRQNVLSVLVAIVAASCVAIAQEKPSAPLTDPEAYSVYAVLLPKVWSGPLRELIVQNETATHLLGCTPSNGPLDPAWLRVVSGYVSENSSKRMLQRGVVPNWNFQLGAADTVRSSNAYIRVSAVGFDDTKGRALVYAEYLQRSGTRYGGGGRYYFLEKVNGSWTEVRVPPGNTCGFDI